MIKKIIFCLFITFSLTACTKVDPLSERLIVESIGIDYDEQNRNYLLSIQLFTPQGGSSPTTIDPTQSNIKLLETQGSSLYEALENATLLIGDNFFYGNTRIILLGEEASKDCLQEVMDFLNNFSETSANLMLVSTKGKALDVLKLNITEGITPGVALINLLKNSRLSGNSIDFSFLEFSQAFLSQTVSPVLPVIKLTEKQESTDSSSEKGDSKSSSKTPNVSPITLDGTAVFFNKKLMGYLTNIESRALAIMRNKIESANYKVKIDKLKYANILLYDLHSKIKIEKEGNSIYAKVTIKAQGDLKAFTYSDGVNGLKDEDIQQLEEEVKKVIEADCQQLINKSLKVYQVDLFRLGDKIWKKDKTVYRQILDNYADFLKIFEVTLDIDVNLNRIGLESVLK